MWVAYDANLGTLLRTCDAIGACLTAPHTKHYRNVLAVGDTLRDRRPCIHWVSPTKEGWIEEQRAAGKRIVAVELAEDATPLPRLAPAREATVLLLGLRVPDEITPRLMAAFAARERPTLRLTGRGASGRSSPAGDARPVSPSEGLA